MIMLDTPLETTTHDALDEALSEAWAAITKQLSERFGEAIYRSWLKPLHYVGSEAGKIVLGVPTRFMREWINKHYMKDIAGLWSEALSAEGVELELRVVESQAASAQIAGATAATPQPFHVITPQSWQGSEAAQEADAQMSAPLDPRYSFENFVVGKPNELAHAAARRIAEATTVVPGCNPLFLYGGVGLGKTHLMHAIAWHIRKTNPSRRVLYLSAEKFMYQFIRALRFKEALAFKEHFRSVDVLMIDDVQFISGKDSTQEEFFHTFNALVDQNKQLVISGDRSPSDLEGLEERVRSRLGWGLVADIHSTSYELRLGILQSKVEQMSGIEVPQKVLEFLAHKITSNVRELEGSLNRVVAHSTLIGRPITLEATQEVLHDLLRANDRRISIEDIQKHVATHYNVKVSDMHSARRSRVVARPRQVAMYLSKKLTSKSLPEIGRRFGGKDHTTVMHAVKRIEELMSADAEFSKDLELLTRMLQS
jgi:chromosomal replication initiator protein